MKLPHSRQNDIIVQELENEILIYDLLTHRALSLNETLKIIYQNCDGKTSFETLKQKHKFSDELINLGIDELKKNNLIEMGDEKYQSPYAGMDRREAVRRIGMTSAVALPVLIALAMPVAAQQTSNPGGLPSGTPVTSSAINDNNCRMRLQMQCRSNAVNDYMSTPFPNGGLGVNCNGTCA